MEVVSLENLASKSAEMDEVTHGSSYPATLHTIYGALHRMVK